MRKESMLIAIKEKGIIENITEVLENAEVFTERMMRSHDILGLIRDNMRSYEDYFKKGYRSRVLFCQLAHLRYVREAVKQGLDLSEFYDKFDRFVKSELVEGTNKSLFDKRYWTLENLTYMEERN